MGPKDIKNRAGQSIVNDAITNAGSSPSRQEKTSFILVVTRNGHMAEAVMNYAVNVADHLIPNTCGPYRYFALLR